MGGCAFAAAQAVLEGRAQFEGATLGDPLAMPLPLVKAQHAPDRAVAEERAAGRKAPRLGTDAECVSFLFKHCQTLASLLPPPAVKKRQRAKAAG